MPSSSRASIESLDVDGSHSKESRAALSFSCRHQYWPAFCLDASFEVVEGVTALFGPSGAGKTTILSTIAGLIHPKSGRIQLGPRLLLDTARAISVPAHRRGVGYVFQDHLLFPHLTVEGNLRYGWKRRTGGRTSLDPQRVAHVLDISHLLTRAPDTLSGGERQRVALGRALLSGPELLLMDEPLASLDLELAGRILAYLERVVEEWQVTTLYVSHRPEEVRRLAERVIVLAEGRVVDQGPAAETLARVTLRELPGLHEVVNLLSVANLAQDDAGRPIAWIGENRLRLPEGWIAGGKSPLVRFTATDVTLVRGDVVGLSIRNHWRGTIRQVAPLPSGRVLVSVDVGQLLWAEVTPEAVAELQLVAGLDVYCLVKTTALRPIEGLSSN